jgi:hypothetical protein
MVHGACSSAGCYSMTDESAGEIFALARDAFKGGQREFQIQAFPFRVTAENMAKHYNNPNIDFWRMLKTGYDSFELTRTPPKVDVCDRRYVFDAESGGRFEPSAKCPAYTVREPLRTALAKKQADDDATIVAMVVALRDGAPMPVAAVATPTAPKQTLVSRLGFGGKSDPTPTATPATAPSVVAASPIPLIPAAPKPTPAPAPAIAATAPTATPVPPRSDPIGTLIERKFWWDDAPVPVPGGAT